MRGMRGTWGKFTRIPGNLLEDPGECYYFNILGNVPKDFGERSRGFWGMFKKIPGNVRKDSGESSKRFPGMFKKILGNVEENSEEYCQIFSKKPIKIERFIMQLNKNRIKDIYSSITKNVRKSLSKYHM